MIMNEELKKLGHETMLLHVGSFREACKEKDEIGNITCVDISFFGTNYIYETLLAIKPDVVISLNTTGVMDRSLILSCRDIGIKTIYLMHGAIPVGDSLNQYIEIKKEYHKSIIIKIKKIKYYLQFVIPNYLFTLYKVDGRKIYSFFFLKVLYSYFRNPTLSQFRPNYTEELIHDKCLVFANSYINYFKELGYENSRIKVVGYPQYDNLFNKLNHSKFVDLNNLPVEVLETVQKGKKYAVYLEEAFVENGNFRGWTNEYRNEHLTEVANRLREEGIFLVVKLHPQVSLNNARIESNNVFVIDKTDLNTLIYYSYFCIVHFSTTINIPIIYNKPIMIPTWGKSKNMPSYFIESGVANEWVAVNKSLNLDINSNARKRYIEEFITVTEPVAKNNIIKNILD